VCAHNARRTRVCADVLCRKPTEHEKFTYRSNVFGHLLKLYLLGETPGTRTGHRAAVRCAAVACPRVAGAVSRGGKVLSKEDRLDAAMKVLDKYALHITPVDALKVCARHVATAPASRFMSACALQAMPADVPLARLTNYLNRILPHITHQVRSQARMSLGRGALGSQDL
jgi:hypothetical protein